MQKLQKRAVEKSNDHHSYGQRTQNWAASLPDAMSIDVLAVSADDELTTRLRSLLEGYSAAISYGNDTRAWEEEIAYLKREVQMRYLRRDAHLAYLRKVDEEHARGEYGLPAGDFDNMAYVYAATGGRPRWS